MNPLEIRKKVIEKDFGSMNDRQFEAVTSVNGPLLVLAGAGSGKTTVLVNRIANLIKYGNAYNSTMDCYCTDFDLAAARAYIEGQADSFDGASFSVDAPRPWEILAITFTNKAADELKTRIARKLGESGDGIWAGTFHSICGKILRRNAERIGYTPHFTIYDTDDQKRVIKDIMKQNNIEEKMYPIKSVLSQISHSKDSLVTPEEYAATYQNDHRFKTIAGIYKEYQNRLKLADAMDFDDMIVNTVNLLKENPDVLDYYGNKFKYIMVDEYQDTNHAQYKLVFLLASVHKNICVVGDDDQSIYRFRGATIENILNFEDDYENAKTIRLEQNYRSFGNILNAANAVIGNNKGRKGKNLWTDRGDGERIEVYTALDERGEAKYVAERILNNVRNGQSFASNAVLYRTNAQSAAMENVFARSGISYRVIGGFRFYERKEIKDVLAYLNLINNHNDDVRLKRIINEPKRGIGDTTVGNAQEAAASLGISLYEVFSHADEFACVSRASAKLKEFCEMIESLTNLVDEISLSDLVEQMLDKTEYLDSLRVDLSPDAQDRIANIEEFVSTVKLYEEENEEPTLSSFLEEIALVSDIDSMNESDDKVTLMTVHAAKGLEFDNVFLIGMEDGIFPSSQATFSGTNDDIEEERRLAYVAITRAKNRLCITKATRRMLYGSTNRNFPSRFLKEIPNEYITETESQEISFGGFGGGYSGYKKQGFDDYYDKGASSFGGYNYSARPKAKTSSFGVSAAAGESKRSAGTGCSFKAGDTVEHTTFGKGMILSLTPMGNDTLIEIAFESVGTKKLMSNYAKLKLL